MSSVDELLEAVAGAEAQVAERRAALAEQVAERDRAIAAALGAGASIGEIARASGLTAARVGQILQHPYGRVGRPTTGRPPEVR